MSYKKVKTGDAVTRNVSIEKFCEKVIKADVKILAITNHNTFDYDQYVELKGAVKDFCNVWPGVELDIEGVDDENNERKRGHLIVIANPKNDKMFNEKVKQLIGDTKADDFLENVHTVFDYLDDCDTIYIPHFHKEPRLSERDIEELNSLLKDKSRLFKETSDYRSLGVFSNFDYSVIIGSDVQDWDQYELSKFADIRLPFQTFEQFCLLAKKDRQIIDTLLNKKRKVDVLVSPHKSVKFKVPIYEDINIIFGQKGTGKSEIVKSLKHYYDENSIVNRCYTGNSKESDFERLLKTNDLKRDTQKLGLNDLKQEFLDLYNWQDELPTSIQAYINWWKTRDNNKNKSKMKITESVKVVMDGQDKNMDSDYKYLKEFIDSDFFKIELDRYLPTDEADKLNELLEKLCESISDSKVEKWKSENNIKLTNWSIDKIKKIADMCSDTVSKPSTTGLYEYALKRFHLFDIINMIEQAFQTPEHCEQNFLGNLEEKGDVFIQDKYRILCKESKTDEFQLGIKILRACKSVFDDIQSKISDENVYEAIISFKEHYDVNGIKDISSFVGISRDTVLGDKSTYQPSGGERGILLLQQLLDSDSDVYLLDEPELGMGNSYITATIMPKLVSLAKQRKTVVVATHNANIAVGTLPYVSIFRTHMNGEYRTYVGNPFCDELYNIDDGTDVKNWTVESMHTLEGGQNAFYERKDIYESGRKDY